VPLRREARPPRGFASGGPGGRAVAADRLAAAASGTVMNG